MTLAETSEAAGISAPYLSNVENGNVYPSPEWVYAVMSALGERIAASAA